MDCIDIIEIVISLDCVLDDLYDLVILEVYFYYRNIIRT